MFDQPPREKEWVSWLAVALWSLIIFFTIPFARLIQAFVSEHFGRQTFTVVVLAAVATGALFSVLYLRRLHLRFFSARSAWLSAVVVLYVCFTLKLRANPEESLHFIEYGVLGILAFRAWTHRIRDPAIYFAAALVGSTVGTLDEIIQWITPRRFFEFRDIRLNVLAVTLVLIGIAMGLRPLLVKSPARARSVRTICRLAFAQLLLLGLCFSNTPMLVNAYTRTFPGLSWLRNEENMTGEIGYLHTDPEIGAFSSRFKFDDLKKQDETRAEEVAHIIDQYRAPDRYEECLQIYSPRTDPFVHELRVHLFRRDRHIEKAEESRGHRARYDEHCTIAFRENQIVEKYFGNTLRASHYGLEPDLKAELEKHADLSTPYASPVSAGLVTGYRVWHRWVVLAAIMVALLAVARYYRVRELRKESRHDQP